MTALIVLGYLLMSTISARFYWKRIVEPKMVYRPWAGKDYTPTAILIYLAWPFAWIWAACYYAGVGVARIVTMPTRKQRAKIRAEERKNQIETLERELL